MAYGVEHSGKDGAEQARLADAAERDRRLHLHGDCRWIIVDLDGTLIRGSEVIAGAADLLDLFDDRWVIVSNNSTHTPDRLAAELSAAGLPVIADRLVLAGAVSIEIVAEEYPGAGVLLAGSPDLAIAAEAANIKLVERHADLVLLGRDATFSYAKLVRIVEELARGAILIATNPDQTHPGSDGPVPETGALLSAILACVTPRVLRIIGKPEPALFLKALERLGAARESCLVIGDNPSTDLAGAARCGMASVQAGSENLLSLVAALARGRRS